MLNGKKNVLLAVTGSIAAYKAADIARGFIKKGYTVTVDDLWDADRQQVPGRYF